MLFLFAFGAVSQETAQVLPSDGTTVAMLCADVNRHVSGGGRIRANVVSNDSPDFAFVIPVAGNIAGANGTFFHSDLSIANRRSVAQVISVAFLRRNTNSGSDTLTTMSLPASSVTDIDDFVGTRLGKTDLGAILVVGQTAAGGIGSSALLDGFSRIWTPQPGSTGTVSQSLSSIPVNDVIADSFALGLKQDSRFRTNVGVVNTSGNTRNFT